MVELGSDTPTGSAETGLVFISAEYDHYFNDANLLLMLQSLGSSGGEREHLYKVLVIGELGCGKTSIVKRYVHQFFSEHYRATVSLTFWFSEISQYMGHFELSEMHRPTD